MSSGSTWNTHFEDNELREVIRRDVLRTLPTLHFFSTPERACSAHGEALIRILFVHAKTNGGIRYVQGMNEVLAPLYLVFATTGPVEDRAHAEADAFACFARLMGEISDIFRKQLDKDMLDSHNVVGRYLALLARLDPDLYRALAAKGVDARFYALRWLSLLFSQEFPLADVERLWDSLFADEDRFTLLLFFACALVIERRRQILASDFSRALYLLQNLRLDSLENTIAYAIQLKNFTPREHLDPTVMAEYVREISHPDGADLLERDSQALQSEIVCCSCSFSHLVFVLPASLRAHILFLFSLDCTPAQHRSTSTSASARRPQRLPHPTTAPTHRTGRHSPGRSQTSFPRSNGTTPMTVRENPLCCV